jgi:hypothetical protein
MSIVNIGQLIFGLLSRIMVTIYNDDGSASSLFYCKLRGYFAVVFTTISVTCFCLATIDQYCATSSRPRFQQWCNIKLAQRLIIIFITIWILHGIPYLIFYINIIPPSTNKIMCTLTNTIFIQYRTYVVVLGFVGFLPVFISILFGTMAYRNVQQLAHYTLPLVRRELDKQLTVMVLSQVIVNCFALLPVTIANAFESNLEVQQQLILNITLIISYVYFAVSVS